MNSILIIHESSNLCKVIPRYAIFQSKSETIFSDSPYCQMAYTGVSWHIFPTNGSKKSSKTEKIFNFTT